MTLGGHEEDRYRGSLAIHVHPHAHTCTCGAPCVLHTREPTRFTAVEHARPYLRKKEREREKGGKGERGSSMHRHEILNHSRSILRRPRSITAARVTNLTGVGRSIVLSIYS